MAGLFATKPLDKILAEANETGEHSLRRALGPFHLIAIGIGSIIGTGIFVLTGTATAHHAGPAILLSFVLAAVACVFSGLCYAEFASMIPVAGSAYTYGYATLGEFIGWIIGWDLILEYALGAATVASGWSGYVLSFLQDFGILLPPKLAGAPGTAFVLYQGHWERLTAQFQKALAAANVDAVGLPHQFSSFNLFGFLGILFVTAVLVIGIKESVTLTSVVVIVKICVLLIFIGLGANYILGHRAEAVANWTPFLPSNTGHYGDFGWSGIATAAGVIFFAYIGFDQVSTAAQESKNPVRDLPIGILGSLAICTVIYILVAGVLTGLVKYTSLDAPAPIAMGIEITGIRWGSTLVKLGAICGLSSAMVVTLLGQSRIFFSMSRDGLLPTWASAVHPRFRRVTHSYQRDERIGFDWDAPSICNCLRRCLDSKETRDGGSSRIRGALDSAYSLHGHRGIASHDAKSGMGNMGPIDHLAGPRSDCLLLLRPQAQQSSETKRCRKRPKVMASRL
jgi:APA family basic amino acid/polyamine antiporter